MVTTPRDPFIEALARCNELGFVQARLGDLQSPRARTSLPADQTVGRRTRTRPTAADVWYGMSAAVQVATGDVDAALDKLTWLAENRTLVGRRARSGRTLRLAPLHSNPRFRALMQKHGVDVTREPFAENRTPVKAEGAK